ncbi:MAG: hypothetical protein ABI382_10400 [Nakamurella sp.]
MTKLVRNSDFMQRLPEIGEREPVTLCGLTALAEQHRTPTTGTRRLKPVNVLQSAAVAHGAWTVRLTD